MDVSRRKFFKICAGGMAGTTAAALGFAPKMALAQARNFKLLRAKEIRNTCTYCSVGCGLLMYSLGDGAKNAKEAIYHIEGDPDHPVSRGALCPKGAGLLDYVHSENRLRYPQYRAPGSDKWQRISWDDAFNRIARLMKADRDANFIEKNEQGVTVNRWLSTGKRRTITMPRLSSSTRALRVPRRWPISMRRFVPVPTLPSCRACCCT